MDYPHADQNENGNNTPPPTYQPAGGNEDAGAEMPPPPTHITVNFRDAKGLEQAFKLKPTTNIVKAMDAFSAKVERPTSQLRFLIDGVRINGGTCSDNEIEDGDIVEVMEEQIGGGGGCCGGSCHCGDKNCDGKCCGGKGGCGK